MRASSSFRLRGLAALIGAALIGAALSAAPGPAPAQGLFDPVIPRGRSAADTLRDRPGCAGMQPARPETAFGIALAPAPGQGVAVTRVDPGGPAAGALAQGDLVLSVNGRRALSAEAFGKDRPERGVYLFGMRGGVPFEAVVWSCAGPPSAPPLPIRGGQYTFSVLYPERVRAQEPAPHRLDPRLILGGYTWAKYNLSGPARLPLPGGGTLADYCRVAPTERIAYTERTTHIRRNAYGETGRYTTTEERGQLVDRALAADYREHLRYIHNDVELATRQVANMIHDVGRRHGCASPEFKDLQRRVYRLFGKPWGGG
ncbi:PDZ domain-containing protein [Rhodovulum sp. DZ06]|uniref:PDZ domain-containing protein n=1 Tax=Rhodovulum sp. DZ06 TaxID=3425126 RepID=UPI003D341738